MASISSTWTSSHGQLMGFAFYGRTESEQGVGKAQTRWTLFPLADCVAAMLHYTTLVVTAFSFVRCRAWDC